MLPAHHLTDADNQQSPWGQALGQTIEDFAAAPATEVDQQALAKNDVHIGHWRTAQLQYVEPGKTNACRQTRHYLILAFRQFLEITLAQLRIHLLQLAATVCAIPRLAQGAETDIRPGHAVGRRMIATRQRFSRTNGQRIGFLTARTANAPQR